MKIKFIAGTLVLLMLSAACSQKPRDIHYGSDECAHCRMMISDQRFASQIVTSKGKVYKFDAIECMAEYTGEHKTELSSAKKYVSNFNNPDTWLDMNKARLVQSRVISSPMGGAYLAFPTDESRTVHLGKYPGEAVEWEALVK